MSSLPKLLYISLLCLKMSDSRDKKKFNHQSRHSPHPPANPFTLEYEHARQLGYLENVAQLNIPKVLVPPLEPHHTDVDNFCIELQNQFRDDLFDNTKEIWAIKRNYSREQVDYLNYWVIEYFEYLYTKLQKYDITYCQAARYPLNYVCYGQRFWDWCVESQLYNNQMLHNYSILLFRLLQLYPPKMLKLHSLLCDANLVFQGMSVPRSEFDFKIATFEPEYDPWKIHNFIKRQGKCTLEDGSLYYKNPFFNFSRFKKFFVMELNRFLSFSCVDVEIEIYEVQFQLKNGPCSWYFTFKGTLGPYNEWPLTFLAISAVRNHFADNFGILFDFGRSSITLHFDRSFHEGSEHYEFASFQICALESPPVMFQVVDFLSNFGRIGELIGHLLYWAHQNLLLDDTLSVTSVEFVLMIMFFFEQQIYSDSETPFPTVDKLTENYNLLKGSGRCLRYEYDLWDDQHFLAQEKWNYLALNAPIKNWMILDFFEFYRDFDFSKYVICPYDGWAQEKETYKRWNANYQLSPWISVAGPYRSMKPIQNNLCTEERMQQFKLLIGRMCLALKDRNQPEMFYIEALTNPEYFLNYENPSDGYQVDDFETEFPALVSEDKKKSNPHELVPANVIESISELVADLSVNEKIVELNQNELETENDLNEISSEESGFEDDQSNSEQSIDNQTGYNEEEDNCADDEDKCRVM